MREVRVKKSRPTLRVGPKEKAGLKRTVLAGGRATAPRGPMMKASPGMPVEPPAGLKNPAGPPAGAQEKASAPAPSHDKNPAGAPRGDAKKPSYGILKAVVILGKNPGGLSPRSFAKEMWPDSPRWKIPTKCGPYGCSRGGGMNLAGGGFLGKLSKRGLAKLSYALRRPAWVLTDQGMKVFENLKAFAEVMK